MMSVRGVACAAVVMSAAMMAACAGPLDGAPSEPSSMSDTQSSALADGVISADEYEEAFSRYRSCLEGAGYALVMQGTENQSYQFGIPAEAVESGVDARCYEQEFRQVDILWQLSHQDTSDATEAMRECLRAVGIEPERDTEKVARQLAEAGISIENCVP
jgi:hypothetical protein